jgi:hypothetical protein
MKTIRAIIVAAWMAFSHHLLHAQTFTVSSLNSDTTPVQSATSDSIVSVVADQQGLQLLTPDQVPFFGTFWLVEPSATGSGVTAPYPCPPFGLPLPTYQMADGQYLVDGTGGGQATLNTTRSGRLAVANNMSAADAVVTQASALVDFITQIQTTAANQQARAAMRAMGMDVPSPGDGSTNGGDGYSPMFSSSYSIDTNGLWLEITNVWNGWLYLNLHNGTNQVYAIWSTTNLLTGWKVETEVWPTNGTVIPTVTPFTVQNFNRQTLFLRAEDWTGVTENGNTTPDWWFWLYFQTTALSDTNLDSQGYTLLYDYQNGLDPNVIQFSLSVTNQYINNMSAPVQLNVTKGMPSYFAVLVDSTNFAGATWNTYTSSNIMAYLGSVQGWHDVWVGLRGLPSNATQTWQWKHLNLTLPPVLVITNPVTGVVDEPMIQIYGYCQDSLASISYDISNAVGVVTNQPSEITDQYYDTNACAFTTNYFECLDVPLTNGLNTIIIHATDLAGDTTTTNFNFTLDYSSKTNPPVVQIIWPTNTVQISGSNFTCRGWINDPTATVTTQLVFTNSNTNLFYGGIYTNVYAGLVERNGNFWLENLPINAGTNAFAIKVTDAVGNTSVTNISVVQSTLVLTVNPVTPASQLWQATVNLTGTISDATYAVWVNGVKGHNNGDGTWSANNVPVNSGGTASFTATAYAPSEQQPDGSYGN